jgi:transcriptional regulator with XRE-family HTH domain
MVNRIKELILKEGLTSGSFADAIGVQRSSMSHILNGRNNPSLDFVVKTLQYFPNLNSDWLLLGTGSMYSGEQKATSQPVRELSIFDPTPLATPIPAPEPKPQRIAQSVTEPIEKQVIAEEKTGKLVAKVLIFYSDKTYAEFFPPENGE